MNGQIAIIIGVLCIAFVIGLSSARTVNAATSVVLTSTAQTETTVTLSWSQSGDWIFQGYNLYYSLTGVNGPYYWLWSTGDKGQTSTFVDGLSPDTSYYFRVDDSGWAVGTTQSNLLEARTKRLPSLTNTATTGTTTSLSWIDYNTYSSLVPFDSYTLLMSTSGSGPWSNLATIYNSATTTHQVIGLSQGGTYYFKMYDTVGSSGNEQTTYSNTLQVKTTPTLVVNIYASTTSTSVGSTVSLSASASGGVSPYSYQWYVNGNPVSGEVSSSFAFIPTSAGSFSIYASVRDSSSSERNSDPIIVNVFSTLAVHVSAPLTTTDLGLTVSITASASGGTQPYSYQWYVNGNPTSGAVSASLAFTPTSTGSFTIYATVQDSYGSEATSNQLTIQVNLALNATASVSGNTIDVGQEVQCTSSANQGTPPYTYQWYLNGSSIQGETSAQYAFATQSAGIYDISLVVQDSASYQLTEGPYEITVNPQLTVSISGSTSITDVGLNAVFTASDTGGTEPISFKWYVNGSAVTGATSRTFTYSPTSSGTFRIYVIATDSVGIYVQSSANQIRVNSSPTITSFSVTPLSSSMVYSNDEARASLSVSGGSSPYKYEWYLNGVNIDNTTSPDYTYTFSSMGNQQIQVKIMDGAGYLVASDVVSTNYSYNYLLFILIAAPIIAVAGVLIYLLHRRTSKRSPPKK